MTVEQTAETQWIGGAMQTVPQRVRDAIMPIIDEFGVELVGIEVAQEGRRTILWVYIDREGGSSLDDCAKIAPELSAILDVVDPVVESYELRVSTPGLDRPLMRSGDFIAYAGETAAIVLSTPVGGRRKFTGIIEGYVDGEVEIACTDGRHRLPLDYIQKARIKYQIEMGKKRR